MPGHVELEHLVHNASDGSGYFLSALSLLPGTTALDAAGNHTFSTVIDASNIVWPTAPSSHCSRFSWPDCIFRGELLAVGLLVVLQARAARPGLSSGVCGVRVGGLAQGPYVYALYASYGFGRTTIALLFTTGFLSAAALGPVVGGLADRYGRKRSCVIGYCGLYGLGCLSKHFPQPAHPPRGPCLSGAATSILFTSFEAWLVAQHEIEHRLPESSRRHSRRCTF